MPEEALEQYPIWTHNLRSSKFPKCSTILKVIQSLLPLLILPFPLYCLSSSCSIYTGHLHSDNIYYITRIFMIQLGLKSEHSSVRHTTQDLCFSSLGLSSVILSFQPAYATANLAHGGIWKILPL